MEFYIYNCNKCVAAAGFLLLNDDERVGDEIDNFNNELNSFLMFYCYNSPEFY
jgi:hypothetical protein